MIIEIKYRDKISWESVKGTATNWTNYSKKYKQDRVQPHDIAPEIVPDTWNGLEHEVQHTRWDSYSFEFYLKESEVKAINQMRSCSDITILEYAENSAGTILNKTYELDLQKSDYFNISEPERMDKTSSWKVTIIFRTERTVINKALPIIGNSKLNFNFGTNAWVLDFTATIPGKLTALSQLSIASLDAGILQKYIRINDTWVKSGNPLDLGSTTHQAITNLDADNVAIIVDGNLGKYNYNNGSWAQIGNLINTSETTPTIAGLSDSRVALYGDGSETLRTIDFDGTDWAQTGNALSVTSAASVYICKLTSLKIAMMDLAASVRDYDFDGTDWAVNQNITLISAGNGAICRLSDDRIATYVENSGNLRSYVLTTDWAVESTLNVGGTGSSLAGLSENEIFLTATTSGVYNFGEETYYSDFDILDWNKDTESVIIDWYDGTRKLLQTVNKNGSQVLIYLPIDNYNEFIENYKLASTIKIGGLEISEPEIEPAQIAQGLYRIVFRGVYETIVTDFDTSPLNSHVLVAGATNFYTDYAPEYISEEPLISQFSNESGVNTATKSISKQVKQVKFYLNESDAFSLKTKFEGVGTVTLDTVSVVEHRPVNPTKIGIDLYEVIILCAFTPTLTT